MSTVFRMRKPAYLSMLDMDGLFGQKIGLDGRVFRSSGEENTYILELLQDDQENKDIVTQTAFANGIAILSQEEM